jgi:hypothetical protein
MVAAKRGLVFAWSRPMVAHAEELPLLASRITDALYSRLEKGQATRVTVVHAAPAPSATIEIVERALLDRVVRAGKIIRELFAAASDDPHEQMAAKSRFTEMFRAAARAKGDGRTPTAPCKMVLKQFERLEEFRG